MLIDIILIVLLIIAAVKGFRRGLIVGIFSLIAIIVGLAAALKLSTVAASYIGNAIKISDTWLPIISFIVVFIIVVILIRLGANLIQKSVELAFLGWVNRLGGILLYVIMYLIVYSVLLFYASQIGLIKPATIEQSVSYHYLQPWGPKVINGLGTVIPFFKGMFNDLETFFDGVAKNVS